MSTKAEVLAAIALSNKAVSAAALVASNLPDPVVTKPPAELVITPTTDGSIVLTGTATTARWTYVTGSAPWGWYGSMNKVNLPVSIRPSYANQGDFIKILYGDGFTKSMDGPKGVVTPVPPTVPTTGPQSFVRNLTVGVNIERLRPLTMKYQGSELTKDPYYRYLASKGLTHVRMFIPYRHDRDMGLGTAVPGQDRWDGLLDAAQAAIMAGLSVFMGCTDVVGEGPISFDDWNTHADNVAKRVAERGFAPSKFALEVANELAGNDNQFWNKMRLDVHDTIRKRLPNHTIVHGCCGWNGIPGWNDTWAMPADNNVILQFHDYGWHDSQQWDGISQTLTAFAKKHGVPMVNGEQGDNRDKAGQDNVGRWLDNFRNMSVGAGLLRPCPWAVSDGSDFRLNRGAADPTLLTQLESTVGDMNTIIRGTPGWGQ